MWIIEYFTLLKKINKKIYEYMEINKVLRAISRI